MSKNKYLFPFIMITSLFFMWGFVHNLDPVLIPHLKRSFSLSTLQASLVDSAVFIAYFVMALPAGFLLKKYGYKKGIIIGLAFFALGSFLFIPAANTQLYVFFLGALFIIACGLTILETAANPYASLLGPPETATFRLNFAQTFNGLAAAMAPIIGVRVILIKGLSDEELSTMTESAKQLALASEASSVKTPYLILGSIILVIAVIFLFLKLPEIKEEEDIKAEKTGILHALRHKHLSWAVAAQFFYVGAQVCVFSFFILYATDVAGISQKSAGDYAGGVGLAFLLGRVLGTFLMKFVKAELLLTIYSLINVLLCIVAITAGGTLALFTVIGIAFFMSIMFPTIFSLGIKDLGSDTKLGSSLIIMSIVGGAVLPPAMGYISDVTHNIQTGYIVPLICFVVVFMFGLKGHKVIKSVKYE
ncbi:MULTISPECIES: L-fucose:H+ symporter permease [Pedobacter]|uniref:L-fucose transporter n=1 Tax=Pedobacter heparinus (strain ATCC 13125 / DSM 2366 / CIP 104194 / JCM 7457 / NBRC 12017 / NCIMB 9290 / NRRL B-14731 / HIM 762-3) TaxID=485917 RepID=C6XWC3_PEDHD|nr:MULTISPECIES: L-fucose:H+ symporter permease [Pedobacter]ACU06212.1 L-fucose transporter [Pedobacter heparinus DSM 2366]MBB5439733.1 FHS family L-fucose permease-like MFS transporter [Pedobacter sp. AK017]